MYDINIETQINIKNFMLGKSKDRSCYMSEIKKIIMDTANRYLNAGKKESTYHNFIIPSVLLDEYLY